MQQKVAKHLYKQRFVAYNNLNKATIRCKVVIRVVRKRLVELRAGRSQDEIAKNLGITRQMLGFIESGDRTPSLPVAKRIADFYNVSVDEIFFEEKSNESLHGNEKMTEHNSA